LKSREIEWLAIAGEFFYFARFDPRLSFLGAGKKESACGLLWKRREIPAGKVLETKLRGFLTKLGATLCCALEQMPGFPCVLFIQDIKIIIKYIDN